MESKLITAAQIRAARALIGWSPEQLAEHSGVAKSTIVRFEAAEDTVAEGAHANTRDKLVTALHSVGIMFIAENGGGVGVRLRKQAAEAIPVEDLDAPHE